MGGCTASKLDNEDTVRRCKERRRFIKEAVQARHNLATAHSDYLRSLRLTGSALFDFASGEPLSVSDQTPAVVLLPSTNQPPISSSSATSSFHKPPPLTNPHKLHHSPSPPPPPLHHHHSHGYSPYSSSNPPKLPHILSESSPCSTPFQKPTQKHGFPANYRTNSTYSSTPSQASSVWNWENFYPPSPPGSDFFSGLHEEKVVKPHHHLSKEEETERETEREEEETERDYDDEGTEREEEEETEREEVHCSEWGDHYSTSSSDTKSDIDDLESRSEIGSRSNFGSSVHNETASKASKSNHMFAGKKSEKSDDAGSSVSWNLGKNEDSNMKMVVRHRDLAEIAAAIKDYFEQAAKSGESVSLLLETGRAQLDQSFRQLKKTVYHSNSVLSHLSSSWTSKPPLEIKYKLDAGSLVESGGPKSHCSTLDRLLAWEKKLYQEVKAREAANIEHEKKLSSLQSQEYRGGGEAKLDKTKASIKRLQSIIVVTSQAVSTTSSAIIDVRDTELAPQLVELCHGLMYMWRSMNQFHELQNHIVQQVRGLVNRANKGESTSELHRQATRHLESAVSSWHTSFCFLVKFQRDYVRSLHSWLKLTLQAIKDTTTDAKNPSASDLFAFLDEWKQALDRLPDTVASESIKSFVNVVHVISTKQSEELKIKKRGESAAKELEKKASSVRNIEKKFYQSYSMVGLGGLPDGGSNANGQVFDARDPLADKKQELAACQRKVEDELLRYAKAVEVTRSMTLNNIQTGLPGVFQALTMFSNLFSEALEGVCTRSYSIK